MADTASKTATAKKTGTSSAASAKKPAPKPAATPAGAKPATQPRAKIAAAPKVADQKPAVAAVIPTAKAAGAPVLKMKDLIERVGIASGAKKKGMKEIVEATLATLGDALAKGEVINLPGFGRAKVAHAEDKGAGKPMTIKMKSQPAADAKKPKKVPLAAVQD
jgi:nucleoid DNA-binding protein